MELKINNYSEIRGVKAMVVIETKSTKGNGTKEDPVRVIKQYWSLNGELLAEKDTLVSKSICNL
ncbi:hypothetical protein [Veillonella sp.]|uniref:hypothetical protein n=1 Tax=Veillonella sp. TaxID=1926307 RepID=UPI0025F4C2CB|nr:hypothetical protein [Veillonella sp.]